MAVSYDATYDPTTPIGAVRFTIQDVDVVSTPPADPQETPRGQWSCLFTDQEIQLRLDPWSGLDNQIDLAAADLLDAIASNAALLAKRIVLGDYTSDTIPTAKGLRDQATYLRNRRAAAISSGSDEPAESVTEEVWTDFDYRNRYYQRG